MVLLSPALNPKACWEFEGDILVLHHPTTISPRYQAMGKLVIYNILLSTKLSILELSPQIFCVQGEGNSMQLRLIFTGLYLNFHVSVDSTCWEYQTNSDNSHYVS